MNIGKQRGAWRFILAAVTALSTTPAWADTPAAPAPGDGSTLAAQFQDPPQSARPRVWWHWMNGNISKDGIVKDLAWMKAVGLGGVQVFDANLQTPQIVDHRLIYMTPEWQEAFRLAVSEADRLGLEFGIASSPGWSETGGPWVPPADGLKKLVWSSTTIAAGKPFAGTIAAPPGVTGPFQAIVMVPGMEAMMSGSKPVAPPQLYRDVAVLAVPIAAVPAAAPRLELADGSVLPGAAMPGGVLAAPIALPHGSADKPTALIIRYDRPQTIRTVSLFMPGTKIIFTPVAVSPVLEASADGTNWRKVVDLPAGDVPNTVSFAPVTSKLFRLVIHLESQAQASVLGAGAPGIVMSFNLGAMAAGGGKPWTLAALTLSSNPAVDRSEAKAGFTIVPDYYALGDPGDGAVGAAPEQVIDLSRRLRADGRLDWAAPQLPAGQQWQVIRLGWSLLGTTNHPATPEATGLEVDKFDRAAVTRYLDHYLALYRGAVGQDQIGAKGIRAFLTDSIEVGAANWTPTLVADFERLRGYDPTPFLPALTGTLVGSRADSDRFLYDYRRTFADLIASAHYGTVDDYARANGMKVYGEALEDHRPSLGDDMTMREHTDVPMAAMWTFPRGGQPKPTYLADTKGAASVAHIYGQNLAAAESMTSILTPWADSPQTLKHVIDLEFLQGINRPVIHESTHQPLDSKVPGLSLFIFGQYFNRLDSWAPLARPWIDYIARNALLLQQGRDAADVGYVYGEEAPLTALYGDVPVADAPKTHGYDFVSNDALMRMLSNDGSDLVAKGGTRYRVLYLGGSSSRMTLATLRKLAELVDGGATVIGMAPQASPSEADAGPAARSDYAVLVARLWPASGDARVGQGRVIASRDIEAALTGLGVAPDFTYTGSPGDIRFVHRKLADGDAYFVVNQSEHPATIEAHFAVAGKAPELWHAETGGREPVSYRSAPGETIIPLTLGAEEAVHVLFRRPAVAAALTLATPAPVELARIGGAWNVAFQPGRGAPAIAVLPALAPLDTSADPGIRYFSGIATYTKDFAAPRGWQRGQSLWLDLGAVHELAEVTVNGKAAGTAWHAPFRLDIGAETQPGRNHVSIRVANLWVNRLIGDAQPGAHKITWTPLPTYRADAPLQPSGLIGPVTLLGTPR